MIAPSVSREALLHVVKNLPAAPQILSQLGHLLLEPNSDLTDVIDLLKRDSGLTARVIRVANSAVYAGAAGVRFGSLEEALQRVGFNEVYRLTGFAAVAQISDHTLSYYGIGGGQFRENSLLTALMMEMLAPQAGVDPRMAYTAGLLRSTGKIAVDRLCSGPTYARSYSAKGNDGPITTWETELVGVTNTEAAGTILEAWRFPPITISAIRDHYKPHSQSPALAHLLNLAAGAAAKAGYPLPGEKSFWEITPAKLSATGVDEEAIGHATDRALERFGPVRAAIS
jgi:HD-like signal output (HDOD) protein